MVVAIKFLINSGVFDPKIGTEIHHPCARRQERLGKLGRAAVWQGKKNNTGAARNLFWIGVGKLERGRSLFVGKARKDLRERLAGQLSRRSRDQVDLRMREEQPHKFLAGVT